MRFLPGPRVHSPGTQCQWVAGPGRTPQGWAVGQGRLSHRGTPTPRQETPPPRVLSRRLHSAQSQLAKARAVGSVTGPHAQTSRTHRQWVAGPGRTPQARAVGRGRAPKPRRPTPRREAPPPGALVPPPQRAKSARKSARCGVGDSSPRPNPPHPLPVGSGPRPHASRMGGRAWESAQTWAPHTQARGAPSARKASSQKQACPQGGERPQARQGGKGTGPPLKS